MNENYLYTDGWRAAWTNVITFIPNFLAFLVILFVGYYVTKWLGKLADRGLEKLGVDRMTERGGLKQAVQRSGYEVSDIIGKIIFYALFLFVLQIAFGVFGPNPISALLTQLIAFLPNIFVALIITVVAGAIAGAVKDIVQASLGSLSYGRFLANAAAVAIWVVGIFAALNQLNVAPEIVNGLFYALLAIVAGSAIVAIGGGGIVPMRSVWERSLDRIESEAPAIRAQVENAPGAVPVDTLPQTYPTMGAEHSARDTESVIR